MKTAGLEKLLFRKNESRPMTALLKAIDDGVTVLDPEGNTIAGEKRAGGDRVPVLLGEEVIGWVAGKENPKAVAALLSHLARRETDKRDLAGETLEKYKELTLLYAVNEKIAACLDPEKVAGLIIAEAKKMIRADNVSVMLMNGEGGNLEILAASGSEFHPKTVLKEGEGIAGAVFSQRRAEIVNDAQSDPRYFHGSNQVVSLMCSPLSIKDSVIGVITISTETFFHYTAADLKLLTTLASQAAAAIEIARLYEAERRLNTELLAAREMLSRENTNLKHNLRGRFSPTRILGSSRLMREVVDKIDKLADTPVNVLITGETGTGKELIAKAIHYNSGRSGKTFVAINCSAIPETIFESEMFGIEKGVATGVDRRIGKIEQADSGTLFLDEIGDMPLSCQAKILRVIEERRVDRVGGREPIPIDIRIIAATNRDLKQEIERGNFREDLYYRLNVVNIHIPPLRDRKEDIPLLLNYFLEQCTAKFGRPKMRFSPEVVEVLKGYNWPGNVRELENEVERAMALAVSDTILPDDLSSEILRSRGNNGEQRTSSGTVVDAEKALIERTLAETGWNKSRASQILGISREGLRKKMNRYGLPGKPNAA